MAFEAYVFAYDFPHRKSEDVILSCVAQGLKPAGVIAAPKKNLVAHSSWKGYVSLPMQTPVHPADLCRRLGVPYHVVAHEDVDAVRSIVATGAVGIVGGARIIPAPVIACFSNGIVNYHPGPIPETSGLDSFYWMIEKDMPPRITTHFIDGRVDAGRLIETRKVEVTCEDTPATVNYKLYVAQLESHRWLVDQLREGKLPSSTPLDRPSRNQPMSDEGRRNVLERFPGWLQRHAA